MFTRGYRFRPWTQERSIADGSTILAYVRETAAAYGVDRKIRYGLRVVRADWSSAESQWTVPAVAGPGETVAFTCGFLWTCSGYYRYDEGYTPRFEGSEDFVAAGGRGGHPPPRAGHPPRFEGSEDFVAAGGRVVHPQHWPDDLDYAGKRVVVIGSGATAVTLVPAMAETAAHVTMLQRSPTYVISLPAKDPLAGLLRKFLSAKAAYPVIRWKNVLMTMLSFQLSRRRPHVMKAIIRKGLEKQLPADYDIDTHFKPRYNPWDQRLCLVPDGDLFKVLSEGRASIVTDTIDRFTEKGVLLTSGEELEAGVVVTATGLNMLALGGVTFEVDGRPVKLSETVGYRGMMFSGIPNLATAVGYTNASWTLKCDLTCEYVCRMLNYMDDNGYRTVVPKWADPSMPTVPFIDLTSGYVQRSIDQFPRQGPKAPWRLYQNYIRDVLLLRHGKLVDNALEFGRGGSANAEPPRERLSA